MWEYLPQSITITRQPDMSDKNPPTPPEGNSPEQNEASKKPSHKTAQVKLPPPTSRVKTKTEQVPVKTSRISLSGKPETKTSQIPLRKETVRITLKASPESRGDKPAAPKPMEAPSAPSPGIGSTPVPPKPPSATTPLKPPIGGAPTVPLRKAPGAPTPGGRGGAPAPTVPLRPSGPTASPTVPLRPAAPGPAATQVLPAATTKLKQTQPLNPTPPAIVPTALGAQTRDEPEEEGSDMANIVLAAVILLTTIFLGLLEYSKSRIPEVQEIGVVQKAAPWTDLLSQ